MQPAYAEAWDQYWHKACSSGVSATEVDQPFLRQFWKGLFNNELQQCQPEIILELACGKGAVSQIAQQCIQQSDVPVPTHLCLDFSYSAVKTNCQQNHLDGGLVADAAKLPIQPESVDLLFSQFGIEYAGEQAIIESATLLRPNGLLVTLLHHKAGEIYIESKQNRDALQQVEDSQIFALARKAFEAGFFANERPGATEAFRHADQALAPAVRQVTEVLQQFGPGVAGGILLQFYRDLGQMFNRMQAYQLNDILNWLDGMERELASYRQRMQSMLDAALDSGQINHICQQLQASGLSVTACEPVTSEAGLLAWQLQARAG